MLDVVGKSYRNCDCVTRREALRVGALAIGGVTLAGLLRRKQAARAAGDTVRDTAVIQIFCGGGPSHIDMYDLKPGAPAEVRGEFREISTNVAGVRICEHLPLGAAVMDRVAVVRSVMHTNPGHGVASQWILTGHQPPRETSDNIFPSCGSIVSKVRGRRVPGMPAYVAVPRRVSFGAAAYLGSAHNPFTTEKDPNDADFAVRNLAPAPGLTIDRLTSRQGLLAELDRMRRDVDLQGDLAGMDSFSRDAIEMVTGSAAARAFDISQEPAAVRERYGRTAIGQNCLLARRLVEAGVSYVTCLSGGGWDTHRDNFRELRETTLPRYDRAVAALVSDIYGRGLDRRVLVMAFGEFGRTPRINRDAGRDHWPGAMSVLLAGGGLKVGQMVGATDGMGAFPVSKPYSPGSVLATMYHVMGIDPRRVFYDRANRPIPVLSEGEPIAELL